MDESEGKYRREPVPATGLTVLFEPKEPTIDIVFIHGFTGHPERTWVSKKANISPRDDDHLDPPKKRRKLNHFSSSHHGHRDSLYWPQDLVPKTVPFARVLTYGYHTHTRPWLLAPVNVNRNTVYDFAWDLLIALEAERRTKPSRPVLFVAHSLGGIIVKEMLRRSSGCRMGEHHLRDIFESTIGIMFFGTPHAGADPRSFLHRVAERSIKATGFSVNEQIVSALLPTAERLRELRNEFGPMARDGNWIIHSFQEQYGVGALHGEKVVDDTSSCLALRDVEITEHIGRSHMEMCRFTGFDDVDYKKVAAALHRMTTSTSRKPSKGGNPSLNKQQKRDLLDSLRFDQIDARRMTIKDAHAKTCTWLLKKSEYLDWLDPSKLAGHHGFLWIRGKPGAGKSTLMKFALANAKKKMRGSKILSFFFNARGDDLEKSTLGMYRSLLLQLLEHLPELQDVFNSLGLTAWNGRRHEWSVESLKALFRQAVRSLGETPLVCFIDALNECNVEEVREMVSFFEQVGDLTSSTGIKLRVCFASRHYPHISIKTGLNLVLEGQEGHTQDLVTYLDSQLKIGHSKLAEQIRADLKEKASGVFMWAVLVVETLNKEYDRGRIHGLRQKLRATPGNLFDLFHDILTRYQNNQGELLLCIQWVLFARQPLKPDQLYYAILAGTEPEALSEWNADEITVTDMKAFILSISKGLIEVTRSKAPTVQFIHESVKDFFLKDKGLKQIWTDLGAKFEGPSHERLKHCCLNYLSMDIDASLNIPSPLPTANKQEAAEVRDSANRKLPFLDYAVQNILYHSDAAEDGGISQKKFIEGFQLPIWIRLNNLVERHQGRRYTTEGSLLYILSERNMAALIRIHPARCSCFDVERERYGTPIFAALATDSHKAIKSLVEPHLEKQPPGSRLRDLCKQFSENLDRRVKLTRDFEFHPEEGLLVPVVKEKDEALMAFFGVVTGKNAQHGDERNQLSCAAEKGFEALMQIVVERGIGFDPKSSSGSESSSGGELLVFAAKNEYRTVLRALLSKGVSIDAKDRKGKTPLLQAAKKGHETVVRLLLEKGAEIESSNGFQTPLSWAAGNGHEAVVRLLLEEGAEIESNKDFQTPLSQAAKNGHEAVVRLLLEKGAKTEPSKDLRTPLSPASRYGHEAVVRLLLEEGAEIESSNSLQTPLSLAAGNGHEGVVRILLEEGAEIESNNGFQAPLSQAAKNGHEAVVQLLLEKGAEIESNNGFQTPLSQAAENGHVAVVRLLLEKGAKVESNNVSQTALSWAARCGHEAVVRLLLEKGAKVESKDRDHRTPLSWAASGGWDAVVRLLLERGAKIESKDSIYGQTPLSWAAKQGYEGVVRLLLEKGAEVESKDGTRGWTPLSWAASSGREAVVRLLLEKGANVSLKDDTGRTPLEWATMYRHSAVARLLQQHACGVR